MFLFPTSNGHSTSSEVKKFCLFDSGLLEVPESSLLGRPDVIYKTDSIWDTCDEKTVDHANDVSDCCALAHTPFLEFVVTYS